MLEFVTYDVFTRTAYAGNPLSIVLEADELSDDQMQRIAREMNLSETIFVRRPVNHANTASVRIFTPRSEIPFAGHPTIGCAVHLASLTHGACAERISIRLEAPAGLVEVDVALARDGGFATLKAPVTPRPFQERIDPASAAGALGLGMQDVGNAITEAPQSWGDAQPYMLIPIASLAALAAARPTEPGWARLTAAAGSEKAWLFLQTGERTVRARMFAPGAGVPEDPATGSAATFFAGLLVRKGLIPDGESEVTIEQGVEMGRPSKITVRVNRLEGGLLQIHIAGGAVKVSEGRLRPPTEYASQ